MPRAATLCMLCLVAFGCVDTQAPFDEFTERQTAKNERDKVMDGQGRELDGGCVAPSAKQFNELSNVFALPTLSVAYGISDWTLGVGVFIPFGGAATWGKNNAFAGDLTYVGAVDSSARWHAISGLWATGYLSTAVAYEIRPLGLSLGVSGNYVYTQLELTQAYSASLDDDLRAEGRMNTQLRG